MFKVGDRVIAGWIHGKGKRGTVTAIHTWKDQWGDEQGEVEIKLDSSGLIESRPVEMVEPDDGQTFWVK
jgi:hypothetical protein